MNYNYDCIYMGKTIHKIRIAAFILILIELIAIITFCVFYFGNVFNLRTLINDEYIIIGSAILIFLDCLFVWGSVISLSFLRQKTDLKAAEVLGSDIQAAYDFAMVGLAVVNDQNIVIWTNDLFKDRNINIIDLDIFQWKEELNALVDSLDSKVVQIRENNRVYDVKLLSEAGLFIFKDVTDLEGSLQYSKEQAPAIGLLSIDNYSDVVGTEEDFNDSIAKVKTAIFAYSKQFGILLRRHRNDTYFIYTNYKTLQKMISDNFSIIAKVREIEQNEDVPLTLSIGVAYNFPDVVKLSELAESAMQIAVSRGGDQVVLMKYGSEMEFIGGKTESQEKRNRVRIRYLADSLISLIKQSQDVIIMGHLYADMDAFGACLGVKAICDRLEKNSRIALDFKNTEIKTRSAITSNFSKDELDEMIVSSKDAENRITNNTLVIVVDVHNPKMVMAPEVIEKANKIVIIDHHRRSENFIESPVFDHIDPSASSTCEIISEFIHFASISPKINLPSMYATIMLSGIFLDSHFFKAKNVGIRTFESCTFLKEFGADNAKADELLKDDYEEHMMVNKIISNIKTPVAGIVYAIAPIDIEFDDATLAKAANELLAIKNINAAFVIGKTGNKTIKMSCRSDSTVNVQLLAEKMGGGGHFSAAAVLFQNQDVYNVEDTLKAVLATSLSEARIQRRNKEEK